MAQVQTRTATRKKQERKLKLFAAFGLSVVVMILLFIIMQQIRTRQDIPAPSPVPYQIAYNRTPLARKASDIKYIVIHDTANTASGADAMSHYNFFNRADQRSSADFFVDSGQVLKVNDFYTYYTWHCGDGQGKNGITNANSIGVELCVNTDGDYDKTYKNAVGLVRQLMDELHIDSDHVVRHYDASGKDCPSSMDDKSWKRWKDFQKKIKG